MNVDCSVSELEVGNVEERERMLDRRTLMGYGGKLALLGAMAPAALGGARLAAAQDDEGDPSSGGTLILVRSDDAVNLTPGENSGLADIAANFFLYDALVIQDFNGEIQPALAESWETSEDGLTWTFHLRQDVTFHSGEPFTSAHVVDHFERWKERATSTKIDLLETIEATDDFTVVCTLSSPTLVFLNNISQTEWAYGSIPNMNKVEELGADYGITEVDGTGPYMLEEWIQDDRMVLVRNENYSLGGAVYENDGAPYPERLIIQVVPEGSSRTNMMETGEADLSVEVSPTDVELLSGFPGVTVDAFSRISSNHIGFNFEKPLFQDINVRKAVQHAIRRDEITEFVMRGQADPAEGYLHPELPGALPRDETRSLVAHDADLAKQLLEESGWVGDDIREKDGETLTFTTYVNNEEGERILQVVQDHLRDVGIDMQITRLDPAAFNSATQAGEHDARFTPMIYTTADHMYFFTTNGIPSPNNLFYSNPEFDDLFQQSQVTVDQEERTRLFGEMERHLLEEAVVIPIQHVRWIFASQERVRGTNFHNIHGTYKLLDTWVE